MNEPAKTDVYNQFMLSKEKYAYFFLTITVAAIGFVITQTQNIETFNKLHIILGINPLIWGISFLLGMLSRVNTHKGLWDNSEYILMSEAERKDDAKKFQTNATKRFERVNKYGLYQQITFIFGIVMFIAWRVLEIIFL